MKVQELRQLLSTADRARLEKAFVESYKKFSKQKKEEVDLIKEITLYRALDLMNMMDEDDMWIQIYEYGVKKKIKPREFLQESYQKRINVKMENKNEQE